MYIIHIHTHILCIYTYIRKKGRKDGKKEMKGRKEGRKEGRIDTRQYFSGFVSCGEVEDDDARVEGKERKGRVKK
jgi:hypothetical protein